MIDVLYMKGYVLVLGINHDRSTVHEGIWFSLRYIS